MKTIIISSGSFSKDVLERVMKPDDKIICADGGATHLYSTEIVPDMIVGDLDSIDEETTRHFKHLGVSFFRFPPEKDLTDTELAVEFAVDGGAKELVLLGVTGTRLDHTLANMMLLPRLLELGIDAKIIDSHNEIIAVDKSIELKREMGTFVSLIPIFSECIDVSMKGFKYPTEKINFTLGSTLGVSNEIISETATIDMVSGMALVIVSRD